MDEVFILFTLFYFVFMFSLTFRSNEFVSFGLTLDKLFFKLLGEEVHAFVSYHIIRVILTLGVHACVPLGYFVGLSFLGKAKYIQEMSIHLRLICFAPGFIFLTFYALYSYDMKYHPVVWNLRYFVESNTDWKTVAARIDAQFRSDDKMVVSCGPRTRVVVTRDWIIAVYTYTVKFAHQDDTTLEVKSADTYDGQIDTDMNSPPVAQFLNVVVDNTLLPKPFTMRINALDFEKLRERLRCRVIVPEYVTFYRSKTEHFLEVFRDVVMENPIYRTREDLETCVLCLMSISNAKLVKSCEDNNAHLEEVNHEEHRSPNCTECRCRPSYCINCLGRWFASRQDERRTDTWLSSKCTCPVCRSIFCILDVCPVERV